MFVIVKLIPQSNGTKLPVIILDGHHEIWEFDNEEEANRMKEMFKENSDSNYEYIIKKI